MTPFLSRRVLGVGLAALIALPLTIGSLRMSGRVIVPVGEVVTEDLYAMGESVIIEGRVEGDVLAIAGELTISGTVTGDVLAMVGGPVEITGTIDGSVRVAAVRLRFGGSVVDDLAAAVIESDIAGSVGRDILLVGGDTELSGSVGRDVLAQSVRLAMDGMVGRDVEVRVDTIALGSYAVIAGDLLYQASEDAAVAEGATVEGRFIRRDVLAPVWAKAVSRMVAILSLFALVVGGMAALWLFRGTSLGAIGAVERHPWRSAAVGFGALLVIPVLLIPLFLTLVGIPFGLLMLVLWVVGVVLGPIPAVTRFGGVLLQGRGGPAAALVTGAVVWRAAMWALPLLAAPLYVAALLVGLGGYVTAAWEMRRRHV